MQEEADRQEEAAAFAPFQPSDFSTPGEGYEVLPCPHKVPHETSTGRPAQPIALWFGVPYNKWYVLRGQDQRDQHEAHQDQERVRRVQRRDARRDRRALGCKQGDLRATAPRRSDGAS